MRSKSGGGKYSIGQVFYRLIREKMSRGGEMRVNREVGMIKKSKKIRKREKDLKIVKSDKQRKGRSVDDIKRKSKTNNIYD